MALKGLHVCPECRSGLVQLLSSERAGARGGWRLWRWCPECGWRGHGVHDRVECAAFNRVLTGGVDALLRASAVLERESMRDFVEIFSGALVADLVGADDFRRRRAVRITE